MVIQGENEQAAVVPAADLEIERNIESARRAYEYGYISEENMSQISH